MGLQRYKQKRNFRATPEPEGRVQRRKKSALKFVIQKHDATRLHYDFRLELEGVLKSWAVPKGIPTVKGDKRLAMHVEDHPLDYGGFEGVIPEGNYGAGSVMLWDNGTWEPVEGDAERSLRAGKLKLHLRGKKLNGEWTLVRMHARSQHSGKDEWLLIKSGADVKPISASEDDESVLTHRTMKQIATQQTRTWKSNRAEESKLQDSFKARVVRAAKAARHQEQPRSKRLRAGTKSNPATKVSSQESLPIEGRLRAALAKCPPEKPKFFEPMKARLVDALPAREDWLLELKHDGYRALAVKDGRNVELFSRSGRKIGSEFPAIVEAIQKLPVEQCVVDGEIVALNNEGHGSFQLLQNRERLFEEGIIVYYAFDLPNFHGRNLRDLPLTQRRAVLEPLVNAAGEPLRFSISLTGQTRTVLAEVKRLGLEGVVGKRANSKYEAGRRTGAWVKLKCVNEQEFIIGGYTQPKGSRDFFGALLVGYYAQGKLMFASKVGSGFTQATLRELHRMFQPLRREHCPFVNLPTKRQGKFGQGVSASEMKICTWLEPKLIAQVRFIEWTSDGGLRHPVYLGLRDDKVAESIEREEPING